MSRAFPMPTVFAVIPVFNERRALPTVLGDLPTQLAGNVVVVDGGSTDGSAAIARGLGADVVLERRQGYGLAVDRGLRRARERGAEAYVVFDGNGTVRARDLARIVDALGDGRSEVVIGTRSPDRLRFLQRLGNRMATEMIARSHGVRYRDVGSVRAFTHGAADLLQLDDLGYGWPLQLQARAAARGLAVTQVSIDTRQRVGRSKVSGTLRGRTGAALAFVRVLTGECLMPIARRRLSGYWRVGP